MKSEGKIGELKEGGKSANKVFPISAKKSLNLLTIATLLVSDVASPKILSAKLFLLCVPRRERRACQDFFWIILAVHEQFFVVVIFIAVYLLI